MWAIFNKPITSPRALKDKLINENEKESLKILNKEMKGVLGKHYKGHKVVSAQVAFYSLSSAFLPESDFYKNKQKFLKDFKAEELLLYKSHFKQLVEFIAEELFKNSCAKIIQSNCNKALKVVEELQEAIKTMIEKQIDPTIKDMQGPKEEVEYRLDRSTDKFISDLKNSAHNEIDQFKFDIGEIMEERIEEGVEDEECKEIFENELKQRETKLIEDIERRFKECEEQFRGSIGKNIEKFKDRTQDSLGMLERISINRGFNLNFDTDSGIDGKKLATSVGGLVLLLLTPIVGEFALIGGLVLGTIGIVKSVWSFFDSDYKKSQQRKEVDKKLDEVCEKIAENVKSRIENYKNGALGMIEELNAGFNKLVDHYERMKGQLKEAHEKLGYISHSINLMTSKQGACNEE